MKKKRSNKYFNKRLWRCKHKKIYPSFYLVIKIFTTLLFPTFLTLLDSPSATRLKRRGPRTHKQNKQKRHYLSIKMLFPCNAGEEVGGTVVAPSFVRARNLLGQLRGHATCGRAFEARRELQDGGDEPTNGEPASLLPYCWRHGSRPRCLSSTPFLSFPALSLLMREEVRQEGVLLFVRGVEDRSDSLRLPFFLECSKPAP